VPGQKYILQLSIILANSRHSAYRYSIQTVSIYSSIETVIHHKKELNNSSRKIEFSFMLDSIF